MAGAIGARYQREEWREPWRVYAGLVNLLNHCVGAILDKLKEQDLYDNSIILFTADHGEMLGSHCLWQKMVLYEESARPPYPSVCRAAPMAVSQTLVQRPTLMYSLRCAISSVSKFLIPSPESR